MDRHCGRHHSDLGDLQSLVPDGSVQEALTTMKEGKLCINFICIHDATRCSSLLFFVPKGTLKRDPFDSTSHSME